MHGIGAIRGWLEVDCPDKWLRWHATQEWANLWGTPQSRIELMSFFDHFLKGIDNGWEKTPKVRMAVLRFGNKNPQSYQNIVEEDFPLPRTECKKLYFGANKKLSLEKAPKATNMVSFNSETSESVSFTYTFEKITQVVGLPKAVLYMSCPDYDDMDVYVFIEKSDKESR